MTALRRSASPARAPGVATGALRGGKGAGAARGGGAAGTPGGGTIFGTAGTNAEKLFLLIFLGSTPITAVAVFRFDQDRDWWAIANSYAFSSAYCALYLWPLLAPRGSASVAARIHAAQLNWMVWLSCFTEIVFQIPHNLCTRMLAARHGERSQSCIYSAIS